MASRKSESEKLEMVLRYRNGEPASIIAKSFNCVESTVQRILRNMGESTKLKKTTTEYKEKILELHKSGKSGRKIEKELGLSKGLVSRLLLSYGIDNSDRWIKREIPLNTHTDEIIKIYLNGENCNSIAKIYDASAINIRRILKKNNIKIRPTKDYGDKFDEKFFEKIDTEYKAYVYGYFMADACHQPQTNTISIEITDLDILQDMAKVMNFEGKIHMAGPRKVTHKPTYRITMTSKIMSDNLIRLGCMRNKSIYAKFPNSNQIPDDLIHHTIRGWL